MAYTPEADSVAGRVCAFFRKHPTDELSTVDIALQFGKPSSSIPALLASAITHQLLARRKDAQLNTLWFAGPKLFHEGAQMPKGVITPVHKPTEPAVQAPAAPAAAIAEADELLKQLAPLAIAPPQREPDAATLEFARQLKQLQLSLDLATGAAGALIYLLDRVDPALPDDQRATADEYQLTRRLAKSALAVIERGTPA